MIGQRRVKLTPAQEKQAYALATERDGGVCVRCRRGGHTQRDHRQNRQPGNTTLANLQLLCGTVCHPWKTTNPREAILAGWGVPRHTTARPSDWPARRWFPNAKGTLELGWVLYFDAPRLDLWWQRITDADADELMFANGYYTKGSAV